MNKDEKRQHIQKIEKNALELIHLLENTPSEMENIHEWIHKECAGCINIFNKLGILLDNTFEDKLNFTL